MAKLSVGYLITLLLPRRLDRWIVGRLVHTSIGVRASSVRRAEDRLRQVLGPHLPGVDFRSVAVEYCEMAREIQWLRMRAYHTAEPQVETSVDGLHRIRDAQATGCGVILWGMSFCETLPVKVALHRAGVPLVHLSSAIHGVPPPRSRLGLQLVGPFFSAPENSFIAERVVIPADESLGYLRLLKDRLRGNACVYIRGDIKSSRRNVVAPLFGFDVEFAPGAPGLSWKLGAPLLPVHVVREGAFQYRAVIHPPIRADRGLDKKHYVHDAVDRFAKLIQRCALESPSSWEVSSSMWQGEWDR